MAEVLNKARALAEGLGDQRRLGLVLGYLAILYSVRGEHARAIEAGENARTIAEAVGDLGLRVVASNYLGQALWYGGDLRRAAESVRTMIALLEGAPLGERFGLPGSPSVLARWFLAVVLAELGEFVEAVTAAEEGLRIAQTAGHVYSEVLARYGLGYAQLLRGNFAQAIRALEPGLALSRATETRLILPYLAELGSAYLWSGRAIEAVPLLEEAVESTAAKQMLGRGSFFTTFLAEAYLVVGRIAEARERAEYAVALARTHPERGWEAWGLKLLGDVHARELPESEEGTVEKSGAEQAGDAYRQALALAAELGMRPLVAHCRFGLGNLRAKTGQREEAREQLATATTLYREMGMTYWLEKAESALKELLGQ